MLAQPLVTQHSQTSKRKHLRPVKINGDGRRFNNVTSRFVRLPAFKA